MHKAIGIKLESYFYNSSVQCKFNFAPSWTMHEMVKYVNKINSFSIYFELKIDVS